MKREQGFIIKYIVIVVAILVLVAYFRNDILNALNSPGVRTALLTAIDWIKQALTWIMDKLSWLAGLISNNK